MANEIRQIALYGKGGIGKSTVSTNVAVALQNKGRKVMVVGCSPKVDSTSFLLGGEPPTENILELSRIKGQDEDTVMQAIKKGYRGIYCAEAGGPEPAEGCAGRGSALALDLLKQYNIPSKLGVDFLIYDVIADVVCGGFSQPMRRGYANEVYIVLSGELMALYSANNICIAISELARTGANVGVAGLICNMRNMDFERDLVEEFSERIGIPVMAYVPRSPLVQEAEARGGTVMEFFPDSEQAKVYEEMAQNILDRAGQPSKIPSPMELEDIMGLMQKYEGALS